MTDHSRREFLTTLGLGGLGLAGCGKTGAPEAQPQRPTQPPAAAARTPGRSRVVIARDDGVVRQNGEVDESRLGEMLAEAMLALTGAGTVAEAWGRFFESGDVVAQKVNALAGPELSTHPELCRAIAEGLVRAGVSEDKVVVFDRDSEELAALGFEINVRGRGMKVLGTDVMGYDREPTVVKAVGTCFSRIVSEAVTALVNVPVLKDHDLAGISVALKNHYGSIHNPNKLHLDHCYPYIADLNCADLIRQKQKLVVCDALNVCYEGGPAFKPATTVPYGALIVTTDPVAADAVGLQIIEALRRDHGLGLLVNEERAPRYIQLAAEYGLGNAALEKIEQIEV